MVGGWRAPAPWAVVVLLAGVFSLHVLAGGSHQAHAMSSAPSSALVHAASHGSMSSDRPAAAERSVASSDTPDTACWPAVPGKGVVLASPGTAVLATAAAPKVLVPSPRRSAAPSRGPPRDLLAQLCVLRT